MMLRKRTVERQCGQDEISRSMVWIGQSDVGVSQILQVKSIFIVIIRGISLKAMVGNTQCPHERLPPAPPISVHTIRQFTRRTIFLAYAAGAGANAQARRATMVNPALAGN